MLKVSVIITAYNIENYIEKAILSVLNQTYKNIECIVVEDCSIDNTLNIIKQYPIKIVEHKENLGAGKSRDDGIKEATGDYVMLLDGDDWLELDCIENLVNVVVNIGGADMVACNVRCTNGNEESWEYEVFEGYDKFIYQKKTYTIFK